MSSQARYTPGEVQVSMLANLVGDDDEVIRDFLADFQRSATALAAEIRAAQRAGHLAEVGAVAHTLKSSARSVGAMHLGELCAELERAGTLGQKAAVHDACLRFDAELKLVWAALTKYLSNS